MSHLVSTLWCALTGVVRTAIPSLAGSNKVYATALLASLCSMTAFGAENTLYFAEPSTGRKVERYAIELPVSKRELQTFDIPGDCLAIVRAVDQGSMFRGSIVDRRLWHKVESDCHYYRFLNRYPLNPIEDFVSGFDFMNADLQALPFTDACRRLGQKGSLASCLTLEETPIGSAQDHPMPDPGVDSPVRCQLDDGVLRARIHIENDTLICRSNGNKPTLRLINVDYADLNGDRVLDAVLRFVPIGRGSIRVPFFLPLTRSSSSDDFLFVDDQSDSRFQQ